YAARPLYPTNPAVTNIKVDYNLSDKTRMFVRLSREAENQYWPFGVWSGENSGWTSNIPDPGLALGDNLARSIAVNVVQTLNPTPPSGAFYHPDEYEFSDSLAKVKGTHLLKFGFAAEHTLQDQNIGLAVEGLLVTDASYGLTTGNEFGDILSEHYKAYGQQSR